MEDCWHIIMTDFFGYALLNICPGFSLIKAETSVTSPHTLKVLNVNRVLPCYNSLLTFCFVRDIHIYYPHQPYLLDTFFTKHPFVSLPPSSPYLLH